MVAARERAKVGIESSGLDGLDAQARRDRWRRGRVVHARAWVHARLRVSLPPDSALSLPPSLTSSLSLTASVSSG